jgi:AcrR family transcriptional regulator
MSPRPYRLGLRELSVDQTRQRILSAARHVLATQDRLTVDLVAQAADVARVTVYNQFASRSGLLEALFDWLAQRGGLGAMPQAFQQPDPDLALATFVATLCRFWASDRVVLRRLRAMAALDADFGEAVQTRDEWRRAGLRVLLERRGERRPETVDILHSLTSFETFDALARERRATDEVCALVLRVARSILP